MHVKEGHSKCCQRLLKYVAQTHIVATLVAWCCCCYSNNNNNSNNNILETVCFWQPLLACWPPIILNKGYRRLLSVVGCKLSAVACRQHTHIKPDVTPNICTEVFYIYAVNKCPTKTSLSSK